MCGAAGGVNDEAKEEGGEQRIDPDTAPQREGYEAANKVVDGLCAPAVR